MSTLKQASSKARGRPRSEHARVAVLEAAYRLGADGGLKGATIQAIAATTGVSKMTIYKWWANRLHLLIDAYLDEASKALPISERDPPAQAIQAHALQYLQALRGKLGRFQLAVVAECLAETGSTAIFVERYLNVRRGLGVAVIARGQADGTIDASRNAQALYDQIYGTMFYRYQFGLPELNEAFVEELVQMTLSGGGGARRPTS